MKLARVRYRRKHERARPRGWFSLFLRLGGWVSLVLGVGLLIVTAFSASSLSLAARLDREGALAYGVVAAKRVDIRYNSEGDAIRDYFVTFTFKTTEGGRSVETEVSKGYYNASARDSEQPIRYLVSDLSRIEYDIGSYRRVGGWLRMLGLVLGVAGLAALWRFGQAANRAIKARRDGEKRMAVVREIKDCNVKINDKRQARMVWREQDGRVGESLMRNADALRGMYKAGDPIVVFRLGRHAYWEGDVGPPQREVGG